MEQARIQWLRRDASGSRPPDRPTLYAYLLDVDDDLAEEFDVRMRVAVRQLATAKVVDAEVGICDLRPWFDAVGRGQGVLIVDGLLAYETRVGDRIATELLGAGDLIQAATQRAEVIVEPTESWRALLPTRLALLDAEFAERVRPWPQIAEVLLRRVTRRLGEVDALRAIASQPRLEIRLDLLLWHLAARWGRVEPAGIQLTLPLTHRLLGQLVGAERPSVTHALARLVHSGLVSGTAGDLHMQGNLKGHLDALIGPARSSGVQARRRAGAQTPVRVAESQTEHG